DYVGASLYRKSTIGCCQFLGKRLISWQCKKQTIMANSTTEAEYVVAVDRVKTARAKHIEYLVGDEAVHKELGDRMERSATTASSLEVEQDSDGIPTLPNAEIFEQLALMGPKKTAWEQFSSNIATAIICLATNRTFNFSKMIFEGMLKNLDNSDEGSLTLSELTVLCTTLSKKVEDLQNDLKQTKLTYGAAYTKLILRVKKLEHKGRTSADTEILLEQEEPTKLVEDPGSGEKGEKEISTVEVLVSTASAIPKVSTAILERQVYIRKSAKKRKDKGKTIMKDDESVQKKTKKQLKQERLGYEEAIRLQEQINEEERQRIARDAEIAKQLQEEIDIARQEQEKYDLAKALELQKELDKRKEDVAKTTQAHYID
ncbi:ribonuclease H-like domain, reverse transcriptase, RNA-dependent DNA polymerase, partial [Tanacetum coccineum]